MQTVTITSYTCIYNNYMLFEQWCQQIKQYACGTLFERSSLTFL